MFLSVFRLSFKQILMRFFFMAQVIFVSFNFIFGSSGWLFLKRFERDNMLIDLQIKTLDSEIQGINKQIKAWQEDPFFKEKMARETLQMAKASDTIYVLY
jgi:cell division protein FtsB